jgi:hypothetical protein
VYSHTRFHTLHTCSALYVALRMQSLLRIVGVCVCRVSQSLMYFTAWSRMCILTSFFTSCFTPYTPAALFTYMALRMQSVLRDACVCV